jgi:GNAT superfamily N-acetyltransferase
VSGYVPRPNPLAFLNLPPQPDQPPPGRQNPLTPPWAYAGNPVGTETTQGMGMPQGPFNEVQWMRPDGTPVMAGDMAAAHGQVQQAMELAPTIALGMVGDAPGAGKVAPMDAFLDAVDAAHSSAGLDKISHINLFPHSANEAEISHIQVDPAHRGKGIGNQIMGMVTDAADQHGITLHASPASDADAATGLDFQGLRDWYDNWGFDQRGGGDRQTRLPGEQGNGP